MPLNAHQQIVEIVSDTPGKGADGFHLLGVDDLGLVSLPFFFQLFLLGGILRETEKQRFTVILSRRYGHRHRESAAVLAFVNAFEGVDRPLGDGLP